MWRFCLAGMNFDNLPLLHDPLGFLFFWVMTLSVSGTILLFFRFKSWL
jgi:Mg2+ and Co2+ transporter CorA